MKLGKNVNDKYWVIVGHIKALFTRDILAHNIAIKR